MFLVSSCVSDGARDEVLGPGSSPRLLRIKCVPVPPNRRPDYKTRPLVGEWDSRQQDEDRQWRRNDDDEDRVSVIMTMSKVRVAAL